MHLYNIIHTYFMVVYSYSKSFAHNNIYNHIAVVVLISFIGGQETLHCSHEILFLSVQQSPPFTQIMGN